MAEAPCKSLRVAAGQQLPSATSLSPLGVARRKSDATLSTRSTSHSENPPSYGSRRVWPEICLPGNAITLTLAVGTLHLRRRRPRHVVTPGRTMKVRMKSSSDGRQGYRINEAYKGARSYGSVEDDDFEEAQRIRESWSGDISTTQESAVRNKAAARKRLLRRRFQRSTQWLPSRPLPSSKVRQKLPASLSKPSPSTALPLSAPDQSTRGNKEKTDETKDETTQPNSSSASDDEGSTGPEEKSNNADLKQEDVDTSNFFDDAQDVRPKFLDPTSRSQMYTGRRKPTSSMNMNDFPKLFMGLGKTALTSPETTSHSDENSVALSFAHRLVDDPNMMRSCSGRELASAASVLSQSGSFASAAILLRYLRDFGIDNDILRKRINFKDADTIFEETSLQLGLALKRAGQLKDAYLALLETCAEPRLLRKQDASTALAEVTLQLFKYVRSPADQVEFLQGAVDAGNVHGALPKQTQEELEITLALSLQSAGRAEESRELLQYLAKASSSSQRRQEAQWALMVQSSDISDEPLEATQEMKKVWDDALPEITVRTGWVSAGRSGAAYSGSSADGNNSLMSFKVGGIGVAPLVLATLVLALPLSIPLLVRLQSSGVTQ